MWHKNSGDLLTGTWGQDRISALLLRKLVCEPLVYALKIFGRHDFVRRELRRDVAPQRVAPPLCRASAFVLAYRLFPSENSFDVLSYGNKEALSPALVGVRGSIEFSLRSIRQFR